MKTRALALGVALAIVFVGGHAVAQADPASATELFVQGRAAIKAGDFEAACAKLTESQRLDPKVGTLLNLSVCEEHLGRLSSARQHVQQAIDLADATSDARGDTARARFAEIDRRVPKLSIRFAPGTRAGVRVERDGMPLGPAMLGTPLPVDAGPHTLVVHADGHEPRSYSLTLREGQLEDAVVSVGPLLGATPGALASTPPAEVPSLSGSASREPSTGGAHRTTGFVVAGAGIVGLGVGAFFGVRALSKRSDSNDGPCNAADVCSPEGLQLRQDARSAGDLATYAFIGGGLALVAGVVLVLTAPRAVATRVVLSPQGVGGVW